MDNIIYSEIKEYSYLLWTQSTSQWGEAKVRAKLNCFGDHFMLLLLFVAEDSPVPPAKVHHWKHNRKKIDLYLPMACMDHFVDMLRHEKHVFAHIDLDHPEMTHLTTEKHSGNE